MLVSMTTLGQAYFTYADCKHECRIQNMSCTITETNPHNFPCDCVEYESSCLHLSSRQEVCLRKGKPPKGGEDIWSDYEKHIHPTPSPPTPTPTPPQPKFNWMSKFLIIYSITTTLILLSIGSAALKYFVSKCRRRDYSELSNSPFNQDGPYRETVEYL